MQLRFIYFKTVETNLQILKTLFASVIHHLKIVFIVHFFVSPSIIAWLMHMKEWVCAMHSCACCLAAKHPLNANHDTACFVLLLHPLISCEKEHRFNLPNLRCDTNVLRTP